MGWKKGDFFPDCLASFLIEPAKILLNRLCFRVNIKMVLIEFSRYTRHVRRFPCEHVLILTDEFDGALSYLGSKPVPIVNCLDESPGTMSTILVSSVGLNLRGGSSSVVGFFRGDISAGSTLA